MTTASKIHARANHGRANPISSEELKRRKRLIRRRVLAESLELGGKILLSTLIAVGALALIVGLNVAVVYSLVFGLNDIADNGWNFWAVVWVLIGFFSLTGGASFFTSIIRHAVRR